MKATSILTRLVSSAIILVLILSCAQESEQSHKAALSESQAADNDFAETSVERVMEKDNSSLSSDEGLDSHFVAPMELAEGRLLEYSIDLNYRTEDLLEARKELLSLIGKYGYIVSGNAEMKERDAYMNAVVHIKEELLYDALQDFDSLGILTSETITVMDHTESMVEAERKIRREEIRIERQRKARNTVATGSKNWGEIEESLQRNEDTADQQEHRKWQINDRVSWAKVSIHLDDPDPYLSIEVPVYRNAFIGMLNVFLFIGYAILWLVPLILLALLLVPLRHAIGRRFRRKKENSSE